MYTYQDLLAVGANEAARAKFCERAVNEFKGTKEYRDARDGEAYYKKHNKTIEGYQKMLKTISGRNVPDMVSSNYKIKTLTFRRLVTQVVQYVLGNGLMLSDPENKKKLGRDFDFKLKNAATMAMYGGRAFGFWNYDHLEVFSYADSETDAGFCPLYDEKTGALMAGVRFWYKTIGDGELFRTTLYEADGYTEYRKLDNKDAEVLQDKRKYITATVRSGKDVVNTYGINYDVDGAEVLPIVPLYANDCHESELNGIREAVDAYDLQKNSIANDLSDTAGVYWLVKNSGGMDDVDLAEFMQRIRNAHAAYAEQADDITAHTVDVPVESRETLLNRIMQDIYDDFQVLDMKNLSAAQKTTQEIQAAYQAQDNKCADFEYYVLDFVQKILAIAGIDDEPSFVWNKVTNQSEQTAMILQAANYLTDEMIIKKLPFLTPEEAAEVIARRDAEDFERFDEDKEEEQE